jgi:hypothetical protein
MSQSAACCPIGMEDIYWLCSAGTCGVCLSDLRERLRQQDAEITRLRAQLAETVPRSEIEVMRERAANVAERMAVRGQSARGGMGQIFADTQDEEAKTVAAAIRALPIEGIKEGEYTPEIQRMAESTHSAAETVPLSALTELIRATQADAARDATTIARMREYLVAAKAALAVFASRASQPHFDDATNGSPCTFFVADVRNACDCLTKIHEALP